MGLATINIRFATDLKGFSTQMQKAERQMKKMSRQMKQVGKGMSTYITAPIVGIGAASLKSYANLETMQTAFESMLGSSSAAKKMTEDLLKFSASTPFQISGIGKASKQLLAAGVAAADVTGKLKVIGDVAAGANIPIEEMTKIFTKGMAKGKLQAEELNQMAERGIPILDELAKMYGVTKGEIYKMASEGKIGFEAMDVALKNMTSGTGIFADQMKKQSNTIAGIFSTLKDNLIIAFGSIGEEIEKAFDLKESMKKTIDFIQDITKKFKELSPEVKKTVIAIAGIAAIVGPLLVITGTVLPAMISGFSILAGPVGLIAVGVAAAAYAILKYFPQIKKAVVDVANYFIELYNQSAIVRLGIEYIKLAFNNTFTFLKTGLGVLIDYLAAFGRVMKGVFTFSWDDVKQGITDFKNNFVNRMGEMADSVEGSFKKAIENVKHNKIELVSSVSVDPEQIKEEIKQQTKKPNTPVIPVDVKQKTNNDNGDSNENVSTGTVQGVNISLLPKIRKSAAEMKIVLADSKKMLVDWSDQVNAAIQNAVAGFAVGLGEMIGHLADGTFSFAEIGGLLVKSIAGLLKSLGEAAIKIGVGMIAVKNAFLNPLGAIAAGVAMVALGSLMENAFNNSSRPMASGGIVYTPTQALVGEYANARRDPEIVAPLSKLRNILGNTGNAGVQIVESGRFVLSGADLKLVLDREMKRQNRTQ